MSIIIGITYQSFSTGAAGEKPGTSWGTRAYRASRFFLLELLLTDSINDNKMMTGMKMNFHTASIKRKQCNLNIHNGILSPFDCSHHLFDCSHRARWTSRISSASPPPSSLSASTRRRKMPQIRPGLSFRLQIFPNWVSQLFAGVWRRCSSRCWRGRAAGSTVAIAGLTKLSRWDLHLESIRRCEVEKLKRLLPSWLFLRTGFAGSATSTLPVRASPSSNWYRW